MQDARAETYDLVVVGGGSGGLTAAAGAASLGLKVALVEAREGLGGDCAYFGCIPSKTLLHAAKVAHQTRTTPHHGLPQATLPDVRLEEVLAHVRKTIAHFTEGDGPDTPHRFAGLGVDVHMGQKARFEGERLLRVGDRLLKARVVFLATGSRPAVPPIKGIDQVPVWTNESFYQGGDHALPKRIVIAGAGPIGVETAQALHRLGSEVILVEPLDCILAREDHDVACWLRGHLMASGLDIRVQSRVEEVQRAPDGGILVTILTGNDARHPDKTQPAKPGRATIPADALFVAAGRKPNVEGLDLDQGGVAYTKTGITVDAKLRTTAKGVYAIGDVNGGLAFTHVAEAQAKLALRNAFFPGSSRWDASHVPWATFTDPELARVGLTEDEARAAGHDPIVHRFRFDDVDRAIADGTPHGLVKIVATKRGKILGAHVVGPAAGDTIHELVLARQHGLTLGKIARTTHIYPTLALAIRRAADQHYRYAYEHGGERLVRLLLRLTGTRPQRGRQGRIHPK